MRLSSIPGSAFPWMIQHAVADLTMEFDAGACSLAVLEAFESWRQDEATRRHLHHAQRYWSEV